MASFSPTSSSEVSLDSSSTSSPQELSLSSPADSDCLNFFFLPKADLGLFNTGG